VLKFAILKANSVAVPKGILDLRRRGGDGSKGCEVSFAIFATVTMLSESRVLMD
jgi:hypothetical protein